jgi:hypothetical protein
MENFSVGNIVKYIGCTQEQIICRSNDDPRGILIEGYKYYVEKVEIHSQHTNLHLRGVRAKFNSVCFEKL